MIQCDRCRATIPNSNEIQYVSSLPDPYSSQLKGSHRIHHLCRDCNKSTRSIIKLAEVQATNAGIAAFHALYSLKLDEDQCG